jgi:hypothetical protein
MTTPQTHHNRVNERKLPADERHRLGLDDEENKEDDLLAVS